MCERPTTWWFPSDPPTHTPRRSHATKMELWRDGLEDVTGQQLNDLVLLEQVRTPHNL